MIYIKIFFLCIIIGSSQDTVNVFTQVVTNEFRKFERELINEVVKLHNRKNAKKIHFKFIEEKSFSMLFTQLENAAKQGNIDNVLCINKISITEERKKRYDFSIPYMINKYVALKLSSRSDINEKDIFNKPLKVAITKGSLYEELAKELDKKNTFTYTYYFNNELCANALKTNEADIFISDYVDTWIYDLVICKMLKKEVNDELGIVFPKGSKLKKKLSKYIEYYVKSPKFYGLIRKFFGKERMNYYKQSIYSGS